MNTRARLLDVIDRSLNGPIVSEQDFDMNHVYRGLKKVLKKYDIKVREDNLLTMDFELADRVWDAAVEFLAECGVFSKDTGRVILFSEKELREYVRLAPDRITYGVGRDACEAVARTLDDERPPLNLGGPVSTPVPNEYFDSMTMSYMQEPRVDMYCPPTNMLYQGREIRTRSPLEIYAAYEEILRFKNMARMAGRPGIHIHGIGISVSDIGQLAAGQFMSEGDGHALGIIAEMKADNTILNKLTYGVLSDKMIAPYANPIYGGLGGGLEGQIVLTVAEMIMCSVVFMGENVGTTPTHPIHFISTSKELLQETSIAFAAISRNSHLLTNLTGTQAGGPGTKTLLYEVITTGIVVAKSGFAHVLGPRGATGAITGANSGLEARFQGEVLHAAAKVSREKAEEIMWKAYNKYKDDIEHKPYGQPYWEVYDVAAVRPKDFWLKMYEEVKEEAIGWGLPLDQI